MALAQVLMVSAIVPSMLLIWYFRSRDANPEPASVLWKTFGLGVLTVIPVLMVALPISSAIEGVRDPIVGGFLKAFLTAAGPEELFKFTVVAFYCARHKEFDEPMDGVVYGATASLGFATLENILYVSSGGLGVAIMRALLAVPGHAFMGAVMGYYVGQAKFRPNEKTKLLALAYFVPFLLHGFYDWPLLSMKESTTAHAADNSAVAPLLLLTLATFVFEWVWTVRIVRRLRSEQVAWAQPAPLAQPTPWQASYPQPTYANPYSVAPQWGVAPMPPPSNAQPVLGALMILAGVILASFGGLIALGGALSLVSPEPSASSDAMPSLLAAVVLLGVLPLALGILSFVFGIKKLNGR